MAAYIDAHRERFGVGPICRVLGAASDCGFLTPRGYRMFKTRPPSRMKARHEALAEYLTCWGPGLLRLGAIMSFGGYCVSRPGLLRLGAVVG